MDESETAKMGDPTTSLGTPAVRAAGGFLHRGKRLSGHLFWFLLGQAVGIGLPHVVLFPLCLHFAGPEGFGRFVYALGMVHLVGMSPTTGLGNTLLRNLTSVAEDRQPLLLRTAFVLGVAAVGGLVLLALLACAGVCIHNPSNFQTTLWIALLVLAMAAQNISLLCTTDLTIRRRFAVREFWQNLGRLLSLLALPGLLLFGHAGMPIGFTLGYVVALWLLLAMRYRVFFGSPQWDGPMAKRVVTPWAVLSLSAVFYFSSHYVHRTILGVCGPYEMVSIFFAAAAALALCAMPVSTLGLFGILILSAYKSRRRFSPRALRWYAAAALAGPGCLYGIVLWVSPWILRLLYPAVADQALQPMSIMTIGIAMSMLMQASRPFVIKFASLRTLLITSIVAFVAHVGAALLLVPAWGITGAAWSYCIGQSIVGVTWYGFFVASLLRPNTADDSEASVDKLDIA